MPSDPMLAELVKQNQQTNLQIKNLNDLVQRLMAHVTDRAFKIERITLAPGAQILWINGVRPASWYLSVEAGAGASVELHPGDFPSTPYLVLINGETGGVAAQGPRLMLRNGGVAAATFTVAAVGSSIEINR